MSLTAVLLTFVALWMGYQQIQIGRRQTTEAEKQREISERQQQTFQQQQEREANLGIDGKALFVGRPKGEMFLRLWSTNTSVVRIQSDVILDAEKGPYAIECGFFEKKFKKESYTDAKTGVDYWRWRIGNIYIQGVEVDLIGCEVRTEHSPLPSVRLRWHIIGFFKEQSSDPRHPLQFDWETLWRDFQKTGEVSQ